jgi:hypothetical protein
MVADGTPQARARGHETLGPRPIFRARVLNHTTTSALLVEALACDVRAQRVVGLVVGLCSVWPRMDAMQCAPRVVRGLTRVRADLGPHGSTVVRRRENLLTRIVVGVFSAP